MERLDIISKSKANSRLTRFLNYAASKGITIFYITNRDTDEKGATIENLKI